MTLRIGTRGSDLAVTQTTTVADALAAVAGEEVELVRISTAGDRTAAPLASLGGTGVFAAALREALLSGECDLAVHSLKDLPTAPTPGLTIGALPPRVDPADALCAHDGLTLAGLPVGARVGTGSPRRAAQVLAARPDVVVADIRGNVPTRLARVGDDLDAVVLAHAGLARLGLLDRVSETIGHDVMLPAPGQGALAVECRTEDLAGRLAGPLAALDHLPTRLAVTAERSLLRTLEAGCAAPVAAHAILAEDGTLELTAGAFATDGRSHVRRTAAVVVPRVTDGASRTAAVAAAAGLGERLAAELLGAGAADIAGLPAGARAGTGRDA